MIEKIHLKLADESGNTVTIPEDDYTVEMKLDFVIAHHFSAIVTKQNETRDPENKLAEKFNFAVVLQKYLEDYQDEYVF